MANIKADLRTRIGEFDKKQEIETSVACAIVESKSYAEELEKELSRTMESQQFERSDVPIEDDEEQCSQLTVCRVLRSEEAERVMRDGRYTEDVDGNCEEVQPVAEVAQEESRAEEAFALVMC